MDCMDGLLLSSCVRTYKRTPMASLAYQAAGLRIYSVAPPAHAGD